MNLTASGWDDWLDQLATWTTYQHAAARPHTTIYLRTYQLRRFAHDNLDKHPFAITLDDLLTWLGAHDWATETRRSHRAALRSFYHWAHITGRIAADPAAQLPPIKPPVRKPRPAPEIVVREGIVAACPRVRLMLELAAHTGMRRAEIAVAHTRDVEADLDGWAIRVHGKGDKERLVPLLPWLAVKLRGCPKGYLFPGDDRGHLSPPYVGKLMSRALPDGWTAHTFRHRFSGKAYEIERDIRAVQELLGHASVATTQVYTPVPSGALRAAVAGAA